MSAIDSGEVERGFDFMLESAATSADFRTAYVFCLEEARARRHESPELTRRILRRLAEIRPDDPRPRNDLVRWFGE